MARLHWAMRLPVRVYCVFVYQWLQCERGAQTHKNMLCVCTRLYAGHSCVGVCVHVGKASFEERRRDLVADDSG